MHELSVVAALIELCEENARANGAAKISEIHAKMGVLSGIDRAQFERCFEAFRQGTMCENAALFIESENLRGRCECGFEGEILGDNLNLNAQNFGSNLDLNFNSHLNSNSNSSSNLSLNSSLDFHCPKCGSNELKITAGEDFYLMRLIME